ncbi:DNA-binding transcriptional regulator, MarR family [Parasphingorhabdus marina DSM 22363]|uniref:DNA-binding transcriptional regulator, MarR family n=1 Tax=Parasphingorhabdus marina DSM 22363 TaxID=1123272 RepID=A0A1N6DCJ6_9SPHN|nr:MarR family transcriptional regulator [Parasphingorhabdus marina]SIN68416.1 DNA-binding transcriptional regulator, MarR family [Parasphingorhabdus marina DSM 22363]
MQKAHSSLFRAADRFLGEEVGLSTSQHAVLLILMQHDGAPISAIAGELKMGKSSLTGLIDRMEKKGLVSRRQSADDARSFEIHIRDHGRHLVRSTLPGTKRINRSILEPFSAQEQEVIARFLNHVASNADEIVATQTSRKHKENHPQ